MKLGKAIEILSESANAGMTTFNQDYKDAQKLGIEATKELVKLRNSGILGAWKPLPGETKD